ncbi:hypothetical protein C4K68_07770 [Pokkaliibacter plantistimulans]|uniref:Uncharacterized protein n=1 Tax=Proteobacteria bacterium 228 TaxID=2083153 RepID=A0A2S5KTF0_9PROT|nr:hypothetical protein [Pokkaliibacter plantistimulans]PPC77935.1 hypothetical protein C4K68_07770 [Pokkaliibacter plantistimulans]
MDDFDELVARMDAEVFEVLGASVTYRYGTDPPLPTRADIRNRLEKASEFSQAVITITTIELLKSTGTYQAGGSITHKSGSYRLLRKLDEDESLITFMAEEE